MIGKADSGLAGLVLAGGFSKRMGADKSFKIYRGQYMFEKSAQVLKDLDMAVFISCRKDQAHRFSEYTPLIDVHPSRGPLTGLISAFTLLPDFSLVVMPVDMPYLSAEFVSAFLLDERDPQSDATILCSVEKKIFPLPGIYERSIFPGLTKAYDDHVYSLRDILQEADVNYVMIDTLSHELKNFNTPEDWDSV